MIRLSHHIHLVGIGGAGLSAIARILLERGHKISGSDRNRNALTDALARDGATIYDGHDASYVNGADSVIISSAVPPDHVEVAAARAQNIPVYKRSDIMASLMEGKRVIAVAGTHGKTTTTAMIVHILRECGKDPSYIVGGVMRNTGTNAGVGQGECFVIEADEYENMFLGLRPVLIVLTNIEYDHPDFFRTPEVLNEAFAQFLNLPPTEEQRCIIACADSPMAVQLVGKQGWKRKRIDTRTWVETSFLYGIENLNDATYQGINLRVDRTGETSFDMRFRSSREKNIGHVQLAVPGKHNVLNAMAAIIASGTAYQNDIEFENAVKALETFQGTGRRFELRDEITGVAVIDDYAHHPTAIKVTLEAARQRYPDRQIWAVWQPHTYSRTQALMNEYVTAFEAADHVLITDIYAAREQPIPGVTSAGIVARMNHSDARHTPTFEDTVAVLDQEVQAPAVILIMSAGDAPAIGVEFFRRRQERHETANPAR